MRNLIVILLSGLLFSLPGFAQTENATTNAQAETTTDSVDEVVIIELKHSLGNTLT